MALRTAVELQAGWPSDV